MRKGKKQTKTKTIKIVKEWRIVFRLLYPPTERQTDRRSDMNLGQYVEKLTSKKNFIVVD